jgi:hypothetical protein
MRGARSQRILLLRLKSRRAVVYREAHGSDFACR